LGYNTYIHGNVTRNSLCGYLQQTKYLFFLFTKSENRRAEQVLSRVGISGQGGGGGERDRRVNTVYT
jgi:ABC-type phosphate/phosphonate transport system ATPase subunit